MTSAYKWGAVAFGVTLVSTFVYGQARTPFTRPAYITTPGSVSTSASGDQFVCTNATAVCEVESSINAATMTSTVPAFDIGPTATPDANDRLACFSYGATGSKTRAVCVDTEGDVSSIGSFNSSIASGNQAFTCTNTGCRLSLGSTARYLNDDGTNLEFVAPLQATTLEATTASGSTLTGGSASGPMLFTSNTPDSHTSTSVPAFLFKPANSLTLGDALFQVQTSAAADVLRVRADQLVVVNGTGRVSAASYTNFSGEASLETWRSDASGVTGVSIGSFNALTNDNNKLVSIRNGGNFATEVAAFSKDGLLRVNASNAAKPTCNSTNRGRVFYLDGVTGVGATDDTYEICMKNASDVYAWKTIVTP